MMTFKKMMGAAALAAGGTSTLALLTTGSAFADIGWQPKDMIQTTSDYDVDFTEVNQSTFADMVQQITTFLFGMAIVAVVLRIVLTALDRLVFGGNDSGGGPGGRPGMGGRGGAGGREGGVLTQIPVIGAYTADYQWKDIIKNVIKNVAIVAGAWVLVNFLVGIVDFIFTTLIKG